MVRPPEARRNVAFPVQPLARSPPEAGGAAGVRGRVLSTAEARGWAGGGGEALTWRKQSTRGHKKATAVRLRDDSISI